MSAGGDLAYWFGEGRFGAATALFAAQAGYRVIDDWKVAPPSPVGPYAIALDCLDFPLLRRMESRFESADIRWTFVAPFRNNILFSPIFGSGFRICVTCLERRILSLPPIGGESEHEAHLLRHIVRHQAQMAAAFTPAIVRITTKIVTSRLAEEDPSNVRNCILVDQLGSSHSSARLTALHGCKRCRPNSPAASERFSAAFKSLTKEQPA